MAKNKFNTTIPTGTLVALKGGTRTEYGKVTKLGVEIHTPPLGTKLLLVKFKGRTLLSLDKKVTFDKERQKKMLGK